jgi:uncharacterized membrane protein YbhN (UPF0104 family)
MHQDARFEKVPLPQKTSFSRGLVGLLVGLSIIAFCGYTIGLDKIYQSLVTVRPVFLIATFILLFCWLLLGVTNITLMLRPLVKIKFASVFNAYSNANMAALLIPGQIGDAVIIKFFRDFSIPLSQGITVFAADKLITLFWYILFAIYGIYLAEIPFDFQLLTKFNTFSFLFVVLGSALLFCCVFYWLVSFLSGRVRNWITLSFCYLKKARLAIIINISVTFIRTILLGSAYWVTINAYGAEPSLIHVICFSIAAGMVAYIPISFNGLGTVEVSLVYLFSTIGVESAPIISAALTMRIVTLFVVGGCATISSFLQKRFMFH